MGPALAVVVALFLPLAAASVASREAVAQVQKFPQTHSPTQAQPLTVEEEPGRRSVPGPSAIVDDLTPALFLQRALENGRAGMELSQLALQRASRPEVRDLAQRMIADHGRVNVELEAIARERDVVLPVRLDATHRATLETLEVMEGRAFDAAYLGAVQQDHERSIAMFETALEDGLDDPALVAFAGRTLPTWRSHLVQVAQTGSASP